MPETTISPPAVSRPGKPVSEALLNEKVCLLPITPLLFSGRYGIADGFLYGIVGPLPLLPPNSLLARSLIWCGFLRLVIQAESVACVGWSWIWCWEGV